MGVRNLDLPERKTGEDDSAETRGDGRSRGKCSLDAGDGSHKGATAPDMRGLRLLQQERGTVCDSP